VPGKPFLLLDAGANVSVRAEHLVQFAHMGAAFMEVVMGIERPRVALLSNGEEPSKGPEDVVAAHATLSERSGTDIDFVGNVEGFAIGKGVCDVLVADGFSGNIALKVMEGTSDVLLRSVRAAAMSSLRSKLGGLLLKPALGGLRSEIDPEAHAAVLLGLRHLAVVPHGGFTARGFANAIELAARGVRDDVLGRTHERLVEAGALRRAVAPSAAAATVPDES
jgi:glycerol-3-phosphate acyltransferase PlsX